MGPTRPPPYQVHGLATAMGSLNHCTKSATGVQMLFDCLQLKLRDEHHNVEYSTVPLARNTIIISPNLSLQIHISQM